jgi:GTP-binding protein
MSFVDEAVVFVRGGRGGNGAASFRREPFTPRGGPDGGDGGPGGSVILEVSSGVFDLSHLADHPHHRARPGQPGGRGNRTGSAGRDLELPVPDGTVVRDERGQVADLVGVGARAVVARGGRAGRGNASLAGPRNRAPRTAEAGEPGEEHRLELELRIVADVGLVGLPNAGKSTLLSRLTAARPKVADYPFTTLSPNLGVSEGAERFVVADVPGLIEGAHEGRGLGDRFLRHVTRCRALVIVADLSGTGPSADLDTVRSELEAYDPGLARRPFVVAATKADLIDGAERARRLEEIAGTDTVIVTSGLTGEGVEELRGHLRRLVRSAPPVERGEPFVVLRPGRERFAISREADRFRVSGRDVERWVATTDFDDPDQVAALQRRLRREDVERTLAERGARRGDEVVIGDRAFEFLPEEKGRTARG